MGDDCFGLEIRAGLEAEGVDTTHLLIRPGASSQFAFILANPLRSTRTINWIRGTGAPLTEDQLPRDFISRARVLHLDGLDPVGSPAAARAARQAGVAVTLDVGTLREHTLELIGQVDHVIVSEAFKEAFAPEMEPREAVRKLRALGPKVAIITLGRAGSVGFDGRETVCQPAFPVRAVDTTAAGDAYNGGYIHALLEGLDLAGRMRFASAVAALNCTALGGRTALPTREQAARFLESNQGEMDRSWG